MQKDIIEIAGYHAHIYFDTLTRDAATELREKISAKFDVKIGKWHYLPIKPHPKAMYEVGISPNQFATFIPWLMLNRTGLDILIHPLTNNTVEDHTDHALWLGEKLELDIEFLRDFVKKRKGTPI